MRTSKSPINKKRKSSKTRKNSYSPNDPRQRMLANFANRFPKYMHTLPEAARIGNPFNKGGKNKTRRNKKKKN